LTGTSTGGAVKLSVELSVESSLSSICSLSPFGLRARFVFHDTRPHEGGCGGFLPILTD
jgi:hypothetical protein